LNVGELANFTQLTIMAETPDVVLMLICMLVAAWAVRYGIKVVTQYSPLFTVISFAILAVSILLVLDQIDLQNFLPMFDLPAIKYVQGTHIITTIPLGELVVFLMITPNVKLPRRDATKYLFGGFALGGINLLFVKLRDIAVLGNMFHLFTLPSLVVLRLVNLGTAFTRMEILFAVVLIMLLFFKITFLYYVSVIAVAQLMKVKSYRRIVLAMGALIVAYGLTMNPNPLQYVASARETTPIVWTLFEILVPLLTYIIAKLRKLPHVSGAKEV
jgi:spore germination protein KB